MPRSTGMARIRTVLTCMLLGSLVAACGDSSARMGENESLKIGQVVPTLGYITLDTALALDTFADVGLAVEKVQLSRGDSTALAALDTGDIDVAAVGSESALTAIAKGAGDYEIIYAVMPKMSLELTVSDKFLAPRGVTPDSPLEERIQALRGARIGVAGLGGAQQRVSQWLAKRGGLDPDSDLQIINVGAPTALRAGMENGNIDAFLLTAPSGEQAEAAGFGQVLIELGSEIPELRGYYHLVLVTTKGFAANNQENLVKFAKALNAANDAIVNDAGTTTQALLVGSYTKVPPDIMAASVKKLGSGLEVNGALTAEGMTFLLEFAADTANDADVASLNVAEGEGDWWTNEFVEAAQG
jgi:NitT/TauT family transport system substrate-binding protein